MTLDRKRLLWVAIGVLAAILSLEWVWPSGSSATVAMPAARILAHQPGQPIAPRDTGSWGTTVLARPLFSISRRPPKVAFRSAGETAVGQARLAGIMISRRGRQAIFAPEGGGKQIVLQVGAAVNESTIRDILPDRVVMASGAVVRPSFDRNRSTQTTLPFQPGYPNPGFTNPNFPNPNFPNPNFPNPGFPNPGFTPGAPNPAFPNPAVAPQGIQPQNATGDDAGIMNPGQAAGLPIVRPMIPQRRE